MIRYNICYNVEIFFSHDEQGIQWFDHVNNLEHQNCFSPKTAPGGMGCC